MLKRKTDNLAGTQADFIASGCPGCQMQLNIGVQRANLDMQVVHPVQLLDQAYRSNDFSRVEMKATAQSSVLSRKVATTPDRKE